MDRLTQHSKTTMFTDSDVMVEWQRLGPAAFEGLSYYRHYVKIINRLAELEDRFCNEPQTNADRIRALSDEELAKMINGFELFALKCGGAWSTENWLEWLKKETDNG